MIILLSRFATSFMRNICWVNNGNTCPPALCAGGAPDEINELGPNLRVSFATFITVFPTLERVGVF